MAVCSNTNRYLIPRTLCNMVGCTITPSLFLVPCSSPKGKFYILWRHLQRMYPLVLAPEDITPRGGEILHTHSPDFAHEILHKNQDFAHSFAHRRDFAHHLQIPKKVSKKIPARFARGSIDTNLFGMHKTHSFTRQESEQHVFCKRSCDKENTQAHTFTHTHTHTLSLSLSLSFGHSLARSRSLSFYFSLSFSLSQGPGKYLNII